MAPIFLYKPCAINHLLVNMNAFARGVGVKISIGTYTSSGSTMINNPWHAKIDAQWLFYFILLPVGATLIDLAVSMKERLELYTYAHGTLIFDNYDECTPKNHERTHRGQNGQMECISYEHFSEGCLFRTRTMYLVILVQLIADLIEAVQYFVCVVIGIHGRGLEPTIHM